MPASWMQRCLRAMQSTASDLDAEFLGVFVGFQPNQTLNYNSESSTTAWSGTLGGTYDATPLSLSYSGDLSNYTSSGRSHLGQHGFVRERKLERHWYRHDLRHLCNDISSQRAMVG